MAKNNDKDAAVFWDSISAEAKKTILYLFSEKFKLDLDVEEVGEKSFEQLNENLRYHVVNYYRQVIEPQKKQGQTIYDGCIDEKLPDSFTCPRCGASAVRTTTKRGIHVKCIACSYDSNQVFDFEKNRRRGYVMDCMKLMKNMFPQFNYAENIPYSPDILFTGEIRDGTTKYDFKIIWMSWILARVRVEINQHLTLKQFYAADECYIVGRREIVEYLNKQHDALIIHYLVDERESDRILMSRAKNIIKHNITKEDRFKNIQYFIPKELRTELVKSSRKEMLRLITADFFEKIYEGIGMF